MTSNVGTRQLVDSRRRLGFGDASPGDGFDKAAEAEVMTEMRRHFNPEFLNRLDEVILFKPLTLAELGSIVDLMLADLGELLVDTGLEVALTPEAKQWLLDKAGVDTSIGARDLRRTIQRWVQDAISELLIDRRDDGPATIAVEVEAGELSLHLEATTPQGDSGDLLAM
jgi:ATP-dependent Clp protease ATP-binding subunit ClpA